MDRKIMHLALLIDDYERALNFYINILDFKIIEDKKINSSNRWILVSPKGSSNFSLLLVKAESPSQIMSIGKQGGDKVLLFLHTDDFDRDFEIYKTNGVKFLEEPREEVYGKVVVFSDLYGNLWDLIQPS